MKTTFNAIVLFAVIASATGVAFAYTHTSMMHGPKTASTQDMMSADQMMSMCEQIMQDMRSDPVLMKHLNDIMHKHMMHGMMTGGVIMHSSSMMYGGMNGSHPSPSPHS